MHQRHPDMRAVRLGLGAGMTMVALAGALLMRGLLERRAQWFVVANMGLEPALATGAPAPATAQLRVGPGGMTVLERAGGRVAASTAHLRLRGGTLSLERGSWMCASPTPVSRMTLSYEPHR